MQFEVIRKNHKKEIIGGAVVLILIAIVLIVHQSFAKYQTVKNMTIAEGTINYKMSDFQIMAMYKQKEGSSCTEDSCYEEITDRMPTSGYVINESKSYCNVNGSKDITAKLYTIETDEHIMSNLQNESKCYLYFDVKVLAKETILSNITVKAGMPDFSQVATTDEGVYKAKDESGKDSYYWRGAVTNNYVKFANKYWRIIRINGDGTIRLIYQGTVATSTGSSMQIGTSAFNESYNDNMYVGFKYANGQVQGTEIKSTILEKLETWYSNNLSSYSDKIDKNSGFCGDRRNSTKETGAPNGLGGTGKDRTYYGSYYRLITNKIPDLSCDIEDFYTLTIATRGNKSLTYPIGLITADEVALTGGVAKQYNYKYYLRTGASSGFWTMSPCWYNYNIYKANIFYVSQDGYLTGDSINVNNSYGVRPVINLRSDVTLTGAGTASNPYVVQ